VSLWPSLLSPAPGESVVVAGLPDEARPAFDAVRLGEPGSGTGAPAYDHGVVLAGSPTSDVVRRVVASVRPGGRVLLAVPHRAGRRTPARATAALTALGVHAESTLWCGDPWRNPLWSAPDTPSVARWFAEDFAVSWSSTDVLRAALARRAGLGWLAEGLVVLGHVPPGDGCPRC
jgi:hypothetical protein